MMSNKLIPTNGQYYYSTFLILLSVYGLTIVSKPKCFEFVSPLCLSLCGLHFNVMLNPKGGSNKINLSLFVYFTLF